MTRINRILYLMIVLLCGGCDQATPAHLTAAEMAELRSWIKECRPPSHDLNDVKDGSIDRFEGRLKSLVESRRVMIEDLCYAFRSDVSSDNVLGEYSATFWLTLEPLLGMRAVFDNRYGVVTRVYVDYVF